MLKKILGIILLLILAFLIFAAISPKQLIVKKEIMVNQPKQAVFDKLSSLKFVSNQTVWQKKDPKVKKTYRGTDGMKGSVYRWESDVKDVGVGEQEITEIINGKSITSELRFEKPFEMTDVATMYTDSEGSGTKIRWEYQSEKIPFPINAFVALQGVQGQLEKDFEESLANIKSALER